MIHTEDVITDGKLNSKAKYMEINKTNKLRSVL